MAIDDPLSAAKGQLAAEQRGSEAWLPKQIVLRLADLLPAPAAESLRAFSENGKAKNVEYLVEVLFDELARVRDQTERLASENSAHGTFLKEEYPSLIMDGLAKAEQARTKSRIARIAKILARTAVHSPTPTADGVEELMRIASQLTDQDTVILGEVAFMQGPALSGDGSQTHLSKKTFAQSRLRRLEIGVSELFSSGPKLESFGLIREIDGYRIAKSPKPWPYALLIKGLDFIQFTNQSI